MTSSSNRSVRNKEPLSSCPQQASVTEDDYTPPDGQPWNYPIPVWRFWLLSVGVCLGLFLSLIDSSVVATSLYTIGVEFGALDSVNWVALAYTLAYLGCAITFARISDIIGRRNAFATAFIIFFAFSLGCGFAQNLRQLIVFRALQGIGGSGLYSLAMVILPELAPPGYQKYVGAMIGMVIASSGVLGPVLGGILTHYTTWRWIFWINGPLGFISMAIFFLTWPTSEQSPQSRRLTWKSFDAIGSMLTIAAAVLVVFAFQNAGESSAAVWNSAIFIAPLLCGLLSWIALFSWEIFVGRRLGNVITPVFPISLFRNRHYAAGAASTLFIGYPYLLIVFSFPTRAQVVSGKSALLGGIMLLPMLGTTAIGSALAGKVNSKSNYLFETMFAGACLMVIGCGLLTTVGSSKDDAKALGFLTFAGLGFGLSTAAATILATVESSHRDHAPAHGILAQLRVLGGSLGISVSTILLNRESSKYLAGILTPQERVTLGGGETRLSAEQLAAVHTAYSEAFRKGMLSAVIVSSIAILTTLGGFRKERPRMDSEEQECAEVTISDRREDLKPAKTT